MPALLCRDAADAAIISLRHAAAAFAACRRYASSCRFEMALFRFDYAFFRLIIAMRLGAMMLRYLLPMPAYISLICF